MAEIFIWVSVFAVVLLIFFKKIKLILHYKGSDILVIECPLILFKKKMRFHNRKITGTKRPHISVRRLIPYLYRNTDVLVKELKLTVPDMPPHIFSVAYRCLYGTITLFLLSLGIHSNYEISEEALTLTSGPSFNIDCVSVCFRISIFSLTYGIFIALFDYFKKNKGAKTNDRRE